MRVVMLLWEWQPKVVTIAQNGNCGQHPATAGSFTDRLLHTVVFAYTSCSQTYYSLVSWHSHHYLINTVNLYAIGNKHGRPMSALDTYTLSERES